jgi:hypothetical protein
MREYVEEEKIKEIENWLLIEIWQENWFQENTLLMKDLILEKQNHFFSSSSNIIK